MKKVTIKCVSSYSLADKYYIIIFDKYNNKVFVGYTKYGRVELYLNMDVYKVVIIPLSKCSYILLTSFIVNDNNNNFIFNFKKNDNSLEITAILVDKNYDNLPIERGEIKLWQDHTQ